MNPRTIYTGRPISADKHGFGRQLNQIEDKLIDKMFDVMDKFYQADVLDYNTMLFYAIDLEENEQNKLLSMDAEDLENYVLEIWDEIF